MKINKIFLLMFALTVPTVVLGARTKVSNDGWNMQMIRCSDVNNPEDACIGTTASNCKNMALANSDSSGQIDDGDGKRTGKLIMVARTINSDSAYFCPTVISSDADRKPKSIPTVYYEPYRGAGDCYWLFKNASGNSECDASLINSKRHEDVVMKKPGKGLTNIEDRIPMFELNVYDKCGSNVKQEHDLVLAIVGWTPSGHGAFVDGLTVRVQRTDWDRKPKPWLGVILRKSGNQKLLCAKGFTPNSSGTDCVSANDEICRTGKPFCAGYAGNFSAAQHKEVGGTSCDTFRCSAAGFGFKSATDYTCAECLVGTRTGINKDGVCETCAVGYLFDSSIQSCKVAAKVSLNTFTSKTLGTALKSGGYVANSGSNKCWTRTLPEEFKSCILAK